MIGATFLKDVRLLWPLAVIIAVLQAFQTWMSLRFYLMQAQVVLPAFLVQSSIVPMLAAAVLCALIVRLEPPQAERDDWFTRPLSRGRIVLTKIAGVVIMVHAPILMIDFVFGLLIGVEPGQALIAGALRSLYIFAVISLPSLGAAAMAATLGQAIVGAVGLATVFYFLDTSVLRSGFMTALSNENRTLAGVAALPLLAAGLGVILLVLPYIRLNRAKTAAWAAPAAILCAFVFNPAWPHAIGLGGMPAERASTSAFGIRFDAARGPFNHGGDPYSWILRRAQASGPPTPQQASYHTLAQPGDKPAFIFLPLRSLQTPAGEVWKAADVAVVLRGSTGEELLSTHAGLDRPFPNSGDAFGVSANGARLIDDSLDNIGLSIELPPGFLRVHGEEQVRIEAAFDITFLHKSLEAPIAPGQQAIKGFGACTLSPPIGESSSWRITCFEPRMPPYCISLQRAEGGDWVPQCTSDFLPVTLGAMMTGPYPRSPQGGAISAPGNPPMVIQDWRPSGYAQRELTISSIKLNDWTSAANETRPLVPGARPPP
ncbi:MAG TPA: hypothetical protein VG942_02010 [Hyphomonadaceae bacterium]|nr:hypothetical protein [Hyphomonadaceae bacterium]